MKTRPGSFSVPGSRLRVPGISRARQAAAWTTLLLAGSLSLFGLDPKKSVFQFNCQNWTRFGGLPADKINAIVQTPDGYIWLGSQNGLIRFNGLEFKVVPVHLAGAQGQDVAQMTLGNDGRLLFAINRGGVGAFDGRNFTAVGDPRWYDPNADSHTIIPTRDGAIWTGAASGWSRWVNGKPEETFFKQGGPVYNLWEDAASRVWMGTPKDGLFYWEKGETKLFPDAELNRHYVQGVVQDPAGDYWIGTELGLYRYDAQFHRKEIFLEGIETTALLVDRHGVLWVGTHQSGLARYQNGKFTLLQKADGLGSDAVTSLFEDAEGSIWVGTVEGLSQLTDLKFPIYSFKDGMPMGGAVTVNSSAKGGVWVGMSSGASYIDARNTITNYTDPAMFPNRYIRRIHEAKNGDLFVGDGDRNICVVRPNGTVSIHPNELWPEAFAEDASSVLIGIGSALLRFQAGTGRFEPYHFEGPAPPFNWINHLCVARDEAIWAATNNGLFRIKDGQWRRWSTDEDMSADRVHFVFEDTDGSIWGGLPTGLVRIKDGKVTRVTEEHGLSDNRIFAIVPDDRGYFWMASGRGILRVSRESLASFAAGKSRRVDCQLYDGLESVKFNDRTEQGFAGCKTPDGRIWFPNPRGVVVIDPASYVTNQTPPRVHVEGIRVGTRDLPAGAPPALEVSDHSVEFFFSALSFIAPKKLQVRYQLDGFDSAWIDAGGHRSVLYNNLQPGRYTFRVQAANVDGVWNTTDAEYTFSLPAPFYRRLWFYFLCAGGGTLSLFGGYRWKVGHMRAAQQKLKSQNDLLESKVLQRTNELANSLSLLKATLDSTADGILSIRLEDNSVIYNLRFAEMWQVPRDKVDRITDAELRAIATAQVKDPVLFQAGIEKHFDEPESEAFDLIELKDGRFFERYSKPQRIDGKSVGIVVNFRDVTGRKQAEVMIAQASALLDSLLTNTLDMMYFKDRDSRFVRFSANLMERHRLTLADDLKGKSDFDLFPEAQARAYFDEEQEIMRSGRPLVDVLGKGTRADGTPTWVLTTKIPWRDHQGRIIGTFGIARDVTPLKETEFTLAYERDLLKALLDSSPDRIYFKDRASRFLKCSRATTDELAIAPEAIIGKTDFDFYTREHAQPSFDDEQEIMRTGRPLIGKVERETHLAGRLRWILTSKIPLRDNAGAIIGTVGISKDITNLKEAEEKLAEVHRQLLETSRQAGMAEVATSVLHNVGNVLNSVNVSATLVTDQMRTSKASFVPKIGALLQSHSADLATFLATDPKGSKIPAYLSTLGEELLAEQTAMIEELGHLQKNIEHIKEIVSMQQNFAKVSGVAESIPLTEIVDDALRINAGALTRHQVELVRDYQFKPVLTIERHKLMQILVNLIRNAKYACDDGGRPGKKVIVRLTQHDRRLRIAVIDNGVGIPSENLTRIFAHGFTTRKEGHGFGLHSGALVAKELGGSLVAHSDGPGQGAIFTLELPLISDPSPP